MFAYVGTFTGRLMGGAPSEGIYVCRLNEENGALEHIQTLGGFISPSFLARHPAKPILYAVEREWTDSDKSSGAVSTFAIDTTSGHLTQIGRIRSGGEFPAHVSAHPSGRYLFIANPRSGTASALRLDEDGLPKTLTSIVTITGKGPHERQAGPWTHSAYPDPSGRRMVSCDLGVDRILIYDFDEGSGALAPATQPYAQVSSGAGPRHLAFGRDGHFLYVLNEIDSTISVFAYAMDTGNCIIRQTIATLPPDYTERSTPAEIVVSRSGRFLYASNRGHGSIARYAIAADTGRLALLGYTSTEGKTPRNFNITPSGRMLLAANQHSGTIVSFHLDEQTGSLTKTGYSVDVPSPVCVVFY